MGIYARLAFVFFIIGLTGFGGGYAIVSLIRHFVVVEEGWLSNLQFIDVLAISQVTPGPIALNSATFIGFKMGGLPGSLIASIFSILAPFLLVLSISHPMRLVESNKVIKVLRLMRPVVFALLVVSTISIVRDSVMDVVSVLLCILSVLLAYKKVGSMTLRLLIFAILGEIIYLLK